MPARNLDPLDFLDVAAQFTPEQRQVRESVARFVDARVLPQIRDCFEQHRFPRDLVPEMAALGIFGAPL